jgi:hypothetical protein
MKLLIPSTLNSTNALDFEPQTRGKLAGQIPRVAAVKRDTNPVPLDSQTYEREYRNAVIALEAEQHEFLGIVDFVKSFFLCFETPAQRMLKNGYARIAPTGNGLPERTMNAAGHVRNF